MKKEKQPEKNTITDAQTSMEQSDMQTFYETLNDARRKTASSPILCTDREDILLT